MNIVFSGGASPLLAARHRQVISRISKGSQNILKYNFIITTFDCQGEGMYASANALELPGVVATLIALFVNLRLEFLTE